MGGSSKKSQVIGHKHFASVARFIGFRIEKLLGVNFDNRKWIMNDNNDDTLRINEPNLYGENEGGVSGYIDLHQGLADQEPNAHYAAHDDLISGYPYQSYIVLRGNKSSEGFYHGNTNTMRECLLWPKRTRVQNNGEPQWYQSNNRGDIVCEIGTRRTSNPEDELTQLESVDLSVSVNFSYAANEVRNYTYHQETTGVYVEDSPYRQDGAQNTGSEYALTDTNSQFVFNANVNFNGSSRGGIVAIFEALFSNIGQRPFDPAMFSADFSSPVIKTVVSSRKITWYVYLGESRSVSARIVGDLYRDNQDTYFFNHNAQFYGFYQTSQYQPDAGSYGEVDINPIHKIREIITNPSPWGMGRDADLINDVNFKKAADRIWEEGLGVSWSVKDLDCIEAIEALCHHIEAGCRINRQTGQYEMVLFRDDWFADEDIHTISESKIKSMKPEGTNIEDLINQVDVKFYNRDEIKDGAFSIPEAGLIKTMGEVVPLDVEFPYFCNQRNAEIVANWKLKQASTAGWSGTFTTGWRETRRWNKYDLIKLPWSRKWQGNLLVRIMDIDLGDGANNTVSITFKEVISYSSMMQTTLGVDESTANVILPPQPSHATVFELPYYLSVYSFGQRETDDQLSYDSSTSYVAALAAPVQRNSLNAAMYSDDAGDEPDFVRSATISYCEALQLDEAVDREMHSFVVKETSFVASHQARAFAGATANTLIRLNDEFMSFESYDESTKRLTVKRGVLDVPVMRHDAESTLFVFDMADLAINETQFTDGEVVDTKVLTTTPSGVYSLEQAQAHTVELAARAIRPYPPANLKFNGNYWIETHVVSNDLVIAWSHRNRTQQTAATHVDWYASSVSLESGVTYSLELSTVQDGVIHSASGITSDTYTIDAEVLVPNKPHKLKMWSVRDGHESLYVFEHSFFAEAVSLILTASVTSNNASGNTVPTANITVDVDTSLKANLQFDGSSITGKTLPNSTITIEVEE